METNKQKELVEDTKKKYKTDVINYAIPANAILWADEKRALIQLLGKKGVYVSTKFIKKISDREASVGIVLEWNYYSTLADDEISGDVVASELGGIYPVVHKEDYFSIAVKEY